MYRDTLGTFLDSPSCVPVPRAARALFWLGRLRQWRAIDVGTGASEANWLSLHLGVVESVAGTHALAMHRDQWSGPNRRHTYERDMSLQIAMMLALGWNEMAAFALQAWFGVEKTVAGQSCLTGMTGMIVGVAGDALKISVPASNFQRSDALLGHILENWQSDDAQFSPLANSLAERHMLQCRLDTDQSLFDFDHPIEQAMPVELLMLLRLRGNTEMPAWLSLHAALAHPAAVLVQSSPPVQSQRCAAFIERVSRLLPQYRGLTDAMARQGNLIQTAAA
ncbi:hypothetical protein GA566_22815 [Cupriavidus sp. SW-Y-13]|nr:hypothetical protein [Cupriavidus sp. SW-Y-13]